MSKKKTIISVVLVMALAALMLLAYHLLKPKASAGTKEITIFVDHLNEDDKTIILQTDADFLRTVLEDSGIIAGSETGYGLWVQTVDGETADETKSQWWGYSVNGEFAQYGVDEQPVNDGDYYEFILNEGY